jgi:hypothetical protein
MNRIHDPKHPIWDFGRFVVLMGSATMILWANASDFDVTEARSLAFFGAIMGGWSGIERFLKNLPEKPKNDSDD